VGLMDPPDASALKVPDAAAEVGSSMFNSTFLADAGDGAVSGLLAAGAAAPIIGQVFTLLADLKKHLDKHIEAEEECRRMSVWCVSMMAVLGKLAKETTVDPTSKELLQSAAQSIIKMRDLVMKRIDKSAGWTGKLYAFWTSDTYLRLSRIAQNGLDKAIEALSLKVAIDTRADVEKMLKKCEMLPKMDRKLDVLVAMTEESNRKLDQVLEIAGKQAQQTAKQSIREKVHERRETNMDKHNISSDACKKEPQPFAKGATAAVFKAKMDRQTVAVKVVSLQGLSRAQRTKVTKDFVSELDILVGLRHPNVLTVFGAIDDLNSLQLVMQFATEGELGDFLRQSIDSLPLSQQIDFSLQIASGLRYIHSKSVAHRDLKSLNILMKNMDGNMLLLISDFGLSKEEIGATMATAGALGTPSWSSPEILEQSENPNHFQADIWSFGVVVWEVVTRSVPFEGMTIMQVMRSVCMDGKKMTLSVDSGHHQTLVDIVDGCCVADPNSRMSLDRVIEVLEEAETKL